MATKRPPQLYDRIRQILESARTGVARTVNTTQVCANWLIGREIVEEEQKGRKRAKYGEGLMRELAGRLRADYGPGFSLPHLKLCKSFYLQYSELVAGDKGYALRSQLRSPSEPSELLLAKYDAPRRISEGRQILHASRAKTGTLPQESPASTVLSAIPHAVPAESWQPGALHPNLSWTHYRTLLRVSAPGARFL